MILTIKQFVKFWMFFLLLTPCLAWSEGNLLARGQIDDVGSNYIIITDIKFRTLSVVKVFLLNKKPGHMRDLRKGDLVVLSLVKIDKKKYVDTIRVVNEL